MCRKAADGFDWAKLTLCAVYKLPLRKMRKGGGGGAVEEDAEQSKCTLHFLVRRMERKEHKSCRLSRDLDRAGGP